MFVVMLFFFKQKTAYELRISDWSSDVCSSDLRARAERRFERRDHVHQPDRMIVADVQDTRRLAGRRAVERADDEIGRESCRERVCQYVWISVVDGYITNKL